MPPRPSNKKPISNKKASRTPAPDKKKSTESNKPTSSPLDTNTIPLPLQQFLLNVFQTALLSNTLPDNDTKDSDTSEKLDLKPLIQTIKSHLYNRDFDSAFTDAHEELLRAYALRWSATRALGYAGVFKGVLRLLFRQSQPQPPGRTGSGHRHGPGKIVCVGGGAGAEIVALGGVWRDFTSDKDQDHYQDEEAMGGVTVTAVDIADWSSVVGRLDGAMRSSRVGSGSKRYPAPLLSLPPGSQDGNDAGSSDEDDGKLRINFQRADILTLTDDQLHRLYNSHRKEERGQGWTLVTLMFTLNELFSTSMAKTTGFLLRTTDAVQPGTYLLVVDSPGSYSSLTLGKSAVAPNTDGDAAPKKDAERRYPMKFLLDHTLLSVAEGKWEKVVSEDSRWWRREADRLVYEVGEGAGLEDMRFQLHLYRRLAA